MDVTAYMTQVGQQARAASREMAKANTGVKNAALMAIAAAIESQRPALAEANRIDLENGRARHAGSTGADTGTHRRHD